MPRLHNLTQLRLLLADMEREIGLSELTPLERDLLYVADEVANDDREVRSHDVLVHPLLSYASKPTLYRAFSSLVEKNLLSRIPNKKRGYYKLNAL